jgi:hypothetical protein
VFQVHFDIDLSDDNEWQTYNLDRYAAPVRDFYYAKQYKFILKANGRVVDLVSVN